MARLNTAIKEGFIRASGIVTLLILWEIAPRLGWVDAQFIPSFSKVLLEIHHIWVGGMLIDHLTVSIWRIAVGMSAAILIALPAGCALGLWFRKAAEKLDPLFRIFSQVNPFSLMPVFILFFGIGETAKIAIIAWVCLWPILFYTITGIETVEPVLIKSARAMGATAYDQLFKVILPGAAPNIFTGLRVGVGLSFFMLIAAEMIGAKSGLGWMVHNASAQYMVARVYAGALLIALLGVLINKSFLILEEGLFAWKQTLQAYDGFDRRSSVLRMTKTRLVFAVVAYLVIILAGGKMVQIYNNEGMGYNGHKHVMEGEQLTSGY